MTSKSWWEMGPAKEAWDEELFPFEQISALTCPAPVVPAMEASAAERARERAERLRHLEPERRLRRFVISVDTDVCYRCHRCATVCPAHVMTVARRAKGVNRHACIGCGQCFAVCPSGAITYDTTTCADVPEIEDLLRNPISFEQLAGLVATRRSTRNYLPDPVSRETFDRLIDAAHYAPTGANRVVSWMAVSNPDEIAKIRKMTLDWLRTATTENRELGQMFAGTVHLYAAKDAPTGIADIPIAMATAQLLAQTLGLGSCFAGFVTVAMIMHTPFHIWLQRHGIPAYNSTFLAMMIGKPAVQFVRLPPRRKGDIKWIM
jgi:ferredoxin